MTGSPSPAAPDPAEFVSHEDARLAAIHRYDILDTPPDGTFDRISRMAAELFDVPIAIISVVDEDRIWFKSHHGVDVTEIPREPGLCASAILQRDLYVLPDATLDPVALTNPLVSGEFGLRFYAAAPLRTPDGHNLGTLCVIDKQPRTITERDSKLLADLADMVVHELELRLAARTTVTWESSLRKDAVAELQVAETLAEALQAALLPPSLPGIPRLEVGARYRPADRAQVGGDFYDIFPLPRRAWGIVLGDVCGKGPRAAAIATAARYALRSAAIDHDRPAEVLRRLNDALLIDDRVDDDSHFCTAVFARLRPHGDAYQLTLSSGGHPLPVVVPAAGPITRLGRPGTVVGLLPDAEFAEATVRLRPGDVVVFFTDGISEAIVDGTEMGWEGVAAVLGSCRGLSADDIADALVDHCTRGGRQRDDIAVLVLRAPVGTAIDLPEDDS